MKGTEKRGLISKSDLLKAIKAGIATHSAAVSAAVTPAATSGPVAPVFVGAEPTISYPSNDAGTFKDIPNSNMRKIIAKRLAESKASVPHMYTSVECDITQLMALRKVNRDTIHMLLLTHPVIYFLMSIISNVPDSLSLSHLQFVVTEKRYGCQCLRQRSCY